MPRVVPLSFSSPIVLLIAGATVVLAGQIAWRRRPGFPAATWWLGAMGLLCLCLAAGGPVWHRASPVPVAVMVDLSPSTRGANFRDRAALENRVRELLGDTPYSLIAFADGNRVIDPSDRSPLAEMACDETKFDPPGFAAVVMFSDARFAIPQSAPPTYVVVDPGLENVADAAVEKLEIRGENLAATVRNSGDDRTISFRGVGGANSQAIGPGRFVTTRPIVGLAQNSADGLGSRVQDSSQRDSSGPRNSLRAENARPARSTPNIFAELNPGDLWPENDALAIRNLPPASTELWWVGNRNPGGGWIAKTADQLPSDPAEYLAPAVIVLDNVPAAAISDPVMHRLSQYVNDLGGALVILGGDHAFAAGAYPGTILETLSPLASSPPVPTMRWIVLTDSSGSMSDDAGGHSRWELATAAARKLLAALPPEDPVTIGQFSDVVKWWSSGQTAKLTAGMNLPPGDAGPRGPTNLEAALRSVVGMENGRGNANSSAVPSAAGAQGSSAGNSSGGEKSAALPTQLIVLSDCDAAIDHPDDLIAGMKLHQIHLQVLALGDGSGRAAMKEIAEATGGSVTESVDPQKWADSMRLVLRAAMPRWIENSALRVHFGAGAPGVGDIDVQSWNRTWLKKEATSLLVEAGLTASTSVATRVAGSGVVGSGIAGSPNVARWSAGRGTVLAAALSPDVDRGIALAKLVANPPRDPRFAVSWEQADRLGVTLDAIDNGSYLDGLRPTLEIEMQNAPTSDSGSQGISIPQTGPGRYSLSLPAPRQASIATVRVGPQWIDRISVAARYAPEFDAVGNDHAAMAKLAAISGGAVIEPGDHHAIDFHWPAREVEIGSWLSVAGAILVAVALGVWRVR